MEPLRPDELVQRLDTGDPDPALRKLLDQAAWQAFPAPWEEPPPQADPLSPGAPMDAEALQPLTTDMLDAFLKEDDFNAYAAPWGFRLVFFRYSPRNDRVVRMTLGIEGKAKDILFWRMACDRRVEPHQVEQALRLCNAWQNEYRFPRAILELPDPPEKAEGDDEDEAPWNPSGTLVLDYQVPLPKGTTQEGLNEALRRVIGTSWDFWRMARDRFGL